MNKKTVGNLCKTVEIVLKHNQNKPLSYVHDERAHQICWSQTLCFEIQISL